MSCPKNPKKFLFFKYFGSCEPEHSYVTASAFDGYWVKRECKICGCEMSEIFLTQQKMLFQGYNLGKLRKMSFFDTFGKSPEDLK